MVSRTKRSIWAKSPVARILAAVVFCAFLGQKAHGIDVAKFEYPPKLASKAAVLMDADTGQVLYGVNAYAKLPPASLTKIMTCLLAVEYGQFDEMVTVTENIYDDIAGSTILGLLEGEQMSLDHLLYGMMARSANDAANAVAERVGGTIPAFVEKMNDKAKELGAVYTHFVNASGMPHDDHYTTAYDMALITRAAQEYDAFRKYAGAEQYTIPATNLAGARIVTNRNEVFASEDGLEGAFLGKTGWTEEAGNCLMTMAQRDGRTLICVTLNANNVAKGQFHDTKALLEYGFGTFTAVSLPGERFPVQQTSYIDEQGNHRQGELYLASEQMNFLLASGVYESDVTLHTVVPQTPDMREPQNIRLELRVPDVAGDVMATTVGSYPLSIRPLDEGVQVSAEEAAESAPLLNLRLSKQQIMMIAGITLGTLLVLILAGAYFVRRQSLKLYRKIMSGEPTPLAWDEDELIFLRNYEPTEDELDEIAWVYRKKFKIFGATWDDVKLVWRSMTVRSFEKKKELRAKQEEQERLAEEKKYAAQIAAIGGNVEYNLRMLKQGYTVEEIIQVKEKSLSESERLRALGAQLSSDKAKPIGKRAKRFFEDEDDILQSKKY